MLDIPDELIQSTLQSTYYLREYSLIQRMLLKGCSPIWFCPNHLTIRGPARLTETPDSLAEAREIKDYVIVCDYTHMVINPPTFRTVLFSTVPCVHSKDCIYSNMILSSLLYAVDSDLEIFPECEAYTQLHLRRPMTSKYAAGRLALFVERLREGKGELIIV